MDALTQLDHEKWACALLAMPIIGLQISRGSGAEPPRTDEARRRCSGTASTSQNPYRSREAEVGRPTKKLENDYITLSRS
jgi:hypothetical protein